jgi:outer membrane protein assembly factor BamB
MKRASSLGGILVSALFLAWLFLAGGARVNAAAPAGAMQGPVQTGASYVWSTPALGPDGTLYVGSTDGNLNALKTDGTLKWSYQTASWFGTAPVIGPDGTIYVTSDVFLYAVNVDGTLKWKYQTASGSLYSPALGADGAIYMAADAYLYALKADGTLKWKYQTPGSEVCTPPTVGADGTIYVGSVDHYIHALNSDGTLKWREALLPMTVQQVHNLAAGCHGCTGPRIPKTKFTASPPKGKAPLAVQFTDLSVGVIDSWAWDFGDGNASTAQSPSHTYASPGKYKASLTATSHHGSKSKSKNIKVTP